MIERDSVKKLGTFFMLYIAQTVPMSFFSTVIPVMMRESNFSLIEIGLLQLIKLPWILKFLWSPLVDRTSVKIGDYKRWIISSELVYAVLITSVVFLDYETNFYTMLGLIIMAFVASATQDIATDALAVLSFSKKDKSLVNSMQSMGSFAGTMVGGGVLLVLFNMVGWNTLLPLLGLFVVVALVPIIFYRGEELPPKASNERAKKGDMIYFFAQKGICKQVIFLLLYYSGMIGTLAMVKPWLVDLGYEMEQIGVMSGVVGTAVGFCCSFLSGVVCRRISRYRARVIFSAVIFLVSLYFVAISFSEPSYWMLYLAVVLLWGAYGAATVVVYTSAMDIVRPGREGTDFTIQTVVTHVSGIVAAITAGHIAQWYDYSGLFIMESIVALISLFYVIFVLKDKTTNNEIAR